MSRARKRMIVQHATGLTWKPDRGWVDAKTADYPVLPPLETWPSHMIGDAPIKASLRETYAKICHQVSRNNREESEARIALAWCRANNNPHKAIVGAIG